MGVLLWVSYAQARTKGLARIYKRRIIIILVFNNAFMKQQEEKTVLMPVNSLSYSALTQLLRNPLIFKLKHVLGVYNSKMGISGMVGQAAHEALKYYYGGNKDWPAPVPGAEGQAEAIDFGMKYLVDYPDAYIKYGKTGTREKMLAKYAQTMRFYFTEEPEYHEILMCEEKMQAEIHTVNGQQFPLPAVAVPDLVHRRMDGVVEIIDTKFTTSFTKYEDDDGEPFDDYIKIVQAKFLDRLLVATKKIKAARVVFREIKTTENKMIEGVLVPQIRDYIIPLDHEPYDIIFDNLFKDVVRFLSQPEPIYLPNLSDPFDGEQAGLLYAQGLLTSDMSDVEVMHKVKDLSLVSKKFVPSRLDRVDNVNLPPEEKIKMKLAEFGIPVYPEATKVGASVTQYRFKVSAGIRMSTFEKHKEDIAMAIEAKGEVRIIAPIPGTNMVGVEVQNEKRVSNVLESKHFKTGTLSIPLGMDVDGNTLLIPLNEMPHLLIAGATGSGKSVLLHGIIHALTEQMTPEAMELILLDPKRVELIAFSKKPHLKEPVIYEYEDTLRVLARLVKEMEQRYKTLEKALKRDIASYNKTAKNKMAYRVMVIDEFADFMIRSKMEEKNRKGDTYGKKSEKWLWAEVAKREIQLNIPPKINRTEARAIMTEALEADDLNDEKKGGGATVELLVVRLAAMGRAVGIHLIIATQRPSVDVITGLIKANFPTRIALTTASATDSQVILGEPGAEKLGGKGDMLVMHPGTIGKVRLQGFNISE